MATASSAASVGFTTFGTPTDTQITAVRTVRAPRTLVWDCHTIPKHVQRWMLGPDGWTMPVCEIDLRPGGRWRWVWRKASGEEMEMTGTYLEVQPPTRLVNTEHWGGPWPETTNTLVLTESDGLTTMHTTVTYPSREARDNAMATGMKDGWSKSYDRFEEYLATLG